MLASSSPISAATLKAQDASPLWTMGVIALALAALGAALAMVWTWPEGRWLGVSLVIAAAVLHVWRPECLLFLMPASLPWLDTTAYTGGLAADVMDLLILGALGGGGLALAFKRAGYGYRAKGRLLLTVAAALSAWAIVQGWFAPSLPGQSSALAWGLDAHQAVAHGWLWGGLCLPMLGRLLTEDLDRRGEQASPLWVLGCTAGLLAHGVVTLVESMLLLPGDLRGGWSAASMGSHSGAVYTILVWPVVAAAGVEAFKAQRSSIAALAYVSMAAVALLLAVGGLAASTMPGLALMLVLQGVGGLAFLALRWWLDQGDEEHDALAVRSGLWLDGLVALLMLLALVWKLPGILETGPVATASLAPAVIILLLWGGLRLNTAVRRRRRHGSDDAQAYGYGPLDADDLPTRPRMSSRRAAAVAAQASGGRFGTMERMALQRGLLQAGVLAVFGTGAVNLALMMLPQGPWVAMAVVVLGLMLLLGSMLRPSRDEAARRLRRALHGRLIGGWFIPALIAGAAMVYARAGALPAFDAVQMLVILGALVLALRAAGRSLWRVTVLSSSVLALLTAAAVGASVLLERPQLTADQQPPSITGALDRWLQAQQLPPLAHWGVLDLLFGQGVGRYGQVMKEHPVAGLVQPTAVMRNDFGQQVWRLSPARGAGASLQQAGAAQAAAAIAAEPQPQRPAVREAMIPKMWLSRRFLPWDDVNGKALVFKARSEQPGGALLLRICVQGYQEPRLCPSVRQINLPTTEWTTVRMPVRDLLDLNAPLWAQVLGLGVTADGPAVSIADLRAVSTGDNASGMTRSLQGWYVVANPAAAQHLSALSQGAQSWLEMGLLGCLAWLAVLVAAFKRLLASRRRRYWQTGLAVGLAGFVPMVVLGMPLQDARLVAIWLLLLGVALLRRRRRRAVTQAGATTMVTPQSVWQEQDLGITSWDEMEPATQTRQPLPSAVQAPATVVGAVRPPVA